MRLSELQPSPGSKHSKKRVGRGPGSGWGKTAGRGHKGQNSRAGLVKPQCRRIKLLGQGEVKAALVVKVQAVSAQARARVEAAGGRVEVV